MQEIWKDIKGYQGLYQVSNLGRIKSIKRNIFLKAHTNSKGYLVVSLSKNNSLSTYRIHRLVAETFIPNLENKPQVNHINGIKSDNRIDNLEWCTNSENQKHAFKNGLQKSVVGNSNPNSKEILQFSLSGQLIKKWDSLYDIYNTLGISRSSIWRCCTGKYKKSHNFIWKYNK